MMMKELVADFPKQLQKALLIAQSAQLNKSNTAIQNVFISGLGGSGIGGTIVAELVSQEATCPIVINKDYFSPGFINENTLAIICTYSGNTEETIQVLKHCIKAKAKITVITSGGDAAHTINISTTAAIIAAAAGAKVVKHGNRAASSKSGAADLLEALGINIGLDGVGVEKTFSQLGIGFCFAPVFHPAMRFAAPARKELATPTVFNILGPLANPAKPQAAAIGVANERMHLVMAQVL